MLAWAYSTARVEAPDLFEAIAKEATAKIDALDSDGESPLHLATNGGHQAIVDLLLSTLGDAAPGLLKKPNGEGATPIDLAEDPALIAKLKIACGEEDEDADGAGAAFKRTKA